MLTTAQGEAKGEKERMEEVVVVAKAVAVAVAPRGVDEIKIKI